MTVEAYATGLGPLLLGKQVGRGGEGRVFALADDPARALKIYDKPDPQREAKVRGMVAARLSKACPSVAFPEALAFRNDGSFAGFTMSLVTGCQPIHELYSTASRRRLFPTAEWRFLIRAAANLAGVFERVHSTGAVVGDVNGSGVLISGRAVATLIDADSFQIGVEHPCRVGVQEYTPPELQGQRLDGLVRTTDHDSFGLAVLIFQLLFVGRHPFAGVPRGREISMGEAIKQSDFAYSLVRPVKQTPPPVALRLSELPIGLRLLFERAFARGVGPRPTPFEWRRELQLLEADLSVCSLNDRHTHAATIPFCPWCRIERVTKTSVHGSGRPVFSDAGASDPASSTILSAESVIRRAKGLAGEALQPRGSGKISKPTIAAVEFKATVGPQGFLLMRLRATGAGGSVTDPFSKRFLAARDEYAKHLDAWRTAVGAWAIGRHTENLADELDQLRRLRGRSGAQFEAAVWARAAASELSQVKLIGAKVAGIGPRRAASLAAAGIVSAGDVSKAALARVAGLDGRTTLAMLLWRDEVAVDVERRLRASPDARREAASEARSERTRLIAHAERKLLERAGDLQLEIGAVTARAAHGNPQLVAANAAFLQATADLEYLGVEQPGQSPAVAKPIAAALAKLVKKNKKGAKGKTPKGKHAAKPPTKSSLCPICGGGLVKRWAPAGSSPNRYFLGCVNYPRCNGSRPLAGNRP